MTDNSIILEETRKLAIQKGWKVEKVMRCLLSQSLLQKWLREVHNCIVEVQFEKLVCLNQLDWIVTVDYYKPDFSNLTEEADYKSDYFSTYEEALEDGLYNALKLI